jgi:cyclophilin family peptidyl-prolyl cis-trans isomerase
MARTPDPHSATSQFFINTVDNGEKLGPGGASPDGYAVFGKVLEGMEVVDRIRAVPTSKGMLTSLNNGQKLPGSHDDVPQKLMLIQSITRVAK